VSYINIILVVFFWYSTGWMGGYLFWYDWNKIFREGMKVRNLISICLAALGGPFTLFLGLGILIIGLLEEQYGRSRPFMDKEVKYLFRKKPVVTSQQGDKEDDV